MLVDFVKMEGAGNDFIMLDGRNSPLPASDYSRFVARYSNRRRGIGSDGMLVLLAPKEKGADFSMRFFNPDGSEADMCGNGARCISLFAHNLGVAGRKMRFATAAGPVNAEITDVGVKIHMPPAPAVTDVPALSAAGRKFDVHFVNTGVPHAVIAVEDLDKVDVKAIGAAVRYHEHFRPAGTNADFIRQTGKASIAIRTYERGVEDETLACGTGACAAALVAARLFSMKSPVSVLTRGGDTLTIHFRQAEDGAFPDVHLEGPAREVFRGSAPW